MRALLLAAGLGTRLRPMTNTIPKCLVPVRGKPLLGYWFDLLFTAGLERALVNTHYLREQVRQFVAGSPWRNQIDLAHENELLGTGGTVLRAREYILGGAFMVVHADNLSRFDVKAFMRRHVQRPTNTDITMMTFETDSPGTCGIVTEDRDGRVTGFFEKVADPPGNHANGAVYICEPQVMNYLASIGGPFIDLSTQVIPHYVGRICTFHNSDYHRDIGSLESLNRAEAEFRP